MPDIELILVDPCEPVCDAWELAFAQFPEVSIVRGRFEALPEFDGIVSAANSCGLMDGGVDLAITRTGHPRHPFVAHTPTMRVPMSISTAVSCLERTDHQATADSHSPG